MSSKKKHRKKQFKPHRPSAPQATPAAVSQPSAVVAPVPTTPNITVPHLALIRHDVRRVVVLATGFVMLQALLWYLFTHTGVGNTVYGLIKL
jgi:hypothetical protein